MTEEDCENAWYSKEQILEKCRNAVKYHKSYLTDEQWNLIEDSLNEQIHTVLWD